MLYSTPMVQAIFENRKFKTRRIITPQPQPVPGQLMMPVNEFIEKSEELIAQGLKNIISGTNHVFPKCRYAVGDVIWVRETFYEVLNGPLSGSVYYKADLTAQGWKLKWKPGIHMPFEEARLFLRIKSIHPERLQDITTADAIAEGIELGKPWPEAPEKPRYRLYNWKVFRDESVCFTFNPIESFFSLWASINGDESVKRNPWVWVIEFEKITKEQALQEASR